MSGQVGKPENALKRADELLLIGAKGEALNLLYSTLNSRRTRGTPQQALLEKIMLKYLNLCVELRKAKQAKDGLHQYRTICTQFPNSNSLEVVVRYFLNQANDRAKEAQSKADSTVLDVEDLEAEESAESAMLSSMSGEDSKDRTDREIVTPWLKFLWETYRSILEITRNNNKLEAVYVETALQAFQFCLRYKRNTEFRRLCEMLRNHLANIAKYSAQPQAINLNVPESLQLHVDLRFAQLNTASELQLWQEAFRSIGDIHGLLSNYKKAPKPQIVALYYQKLANICWMSKNHLFHAYALNKFFSFNRALNKGLTEDDIKNMASGVLLAILSIPPEDPSEDDYDYDLQKERKLRLGTLLTFTPVPIYPRREALLQEAQKLSSVVLPELRDLFEIIEKRFNPLKFSQDLKPKLEFIGNHPTLKQYLKPLEKVFFIRQLQQFSRVYETMKLSDFTKLTFYVPPIEAERMIVEAVKNNYVDVRIDHQKGALSFKSQVLESEQMRNQLIQLSKNLQSAVRMINPDKSADTTRQQNKEVYSKILASLDEEHKRVLARKALIENRIVERDLQAKRKIEQAEEERRNKEKQAKEEEDRRIAAANVAREKSLQEKRAQEAKMRELEAFAENMRQRTGQAIDTEQLAKDNIDPDEFLRRRIEEHEKKASETNKKYKNLEKMMNWFERAKRDLERPLIEQDYVTRQKEDQEYFMTQQVEVIEASRVQHEKDVLEKQRMSRMMSDNAAFEEDIVKARQEEFDRLVKERQERIAAKRAKLREEQERREREETERRAEQERKRKLAEEEAQRKRDEQETRRREDEERKKKLEDLAEKQRKREEEVLARQRQREQEEREARLGGSATASSSSASAEPRRTDRYEPPSRRDDRDRDFGRRDDRDRYEPPRRDDRDRDFGRRDDREGPRDRYEPPSRRDDRDFGRRDAPPRGGDRYEPPRRDDRERDFGRRDDREAPRGGDRDRYEPPARRDDRDRDFGRRDDREAPRGGDRYEPPRRDDRERDFGRRDDRDAPRGGDRYEPPRRDDRDRDFGRRDDRDAPRRDFGRRDDRDRGERPQESRDNRERPQERSERPPREEPRRESREPEEDDGFTTVRKGRGVGKK